MNHRVFLALACVLLILRVPSLVQPMGADQGLYAYIGERILAGELPYRDAWDHKPPAIHYVYAGLRAVWPHDSVVPAADFLAAVAVAGLLVALGSALTAPATGWIAALLFLFLSDPSFQRLAGVAVRAQCETFMAALVTGAFLMLAWSRTGHSRVFEAGVLFGTAAAFKYNAALYAAAGLFALWNWNRLTWREFLWMVAGSALVPTGMLLIFLMTGTVGDLYDATITYNLQYSGETYEGLGHFVRYLLTFPVQHARVNALWLLGGAGCAVLLVLGLRDRALLMAPAWVAAACLVIAVNGSRGLPQYFVQALPALALAAAWAWTAAVPGLKTRPTKTDTPGLKTRPTKTDTPGLKTRPTKTDTPGLKTRPTKTDTPGLKTRPTRIVKIAVLALVAIAVWRVNEFSNLSNNFRHDASYLLGRMTREEHLARYGEAERRKYSAPAMAQLAEFVRARTSEDDAIYVFGFSGGAYVNADRRSASRFFWSRPVIVNFNASKPGYGIAGLRADLERNRPAIVALQVKDWAGDVRDSAAFFMETPLLADWLRAGYAPVDGPAGFETWQRR